MYLQKYKTLYSKENWITMGKDVEFEEDMESKSTSKLQRVLVKWIQEKTPIGLMTTNGAHHIAKAVYHGEASQEIYETWYDGTQKTTNHLLKNPTSILDISRDSILYKCISVTVHYPKRKCWTKEIVQDLKSYSAAQDQQGILVGVRSWRDTVQSAMEALIDGKECGRWKWDHNHCLDNKMMYPAPWPIDIRRVDKTLCEWIPARDIIIG
jgi:tRNA G10  N-methylase Trm11